MKYYVPLEMDARQLKHEKRVADAPVAENPPPPPDVDRITVPTNSLRQLKTFIAYMNNERVEGREQFLAMLFDPHLYGFIRY
jgi:hypothetical protein